ncbi:branched-subunit amino acid ABC-type transport system permease component [Spinactinospora alkalitolerans]|uniref:Branched-subunit amino acid ABC-type transport system permease component n=1 Tax=Spinactinospora alkalitolerans TaxID=687207 RepID=A0A852TWF6_9ACTN|nr:lasso peptide biosynthesis B2 protein [Spinactinospora alkalitolerans]NYE48846.1 branched-subunit amino acid ABC-type transport system permease component [Spinactinospora alkalitolerans]
MSTHMALPPPSAYRLRHRERLAGLLGFTSAVLLLRLPIKHSVVIVGKLKRHTPKSATMDEAAAAVAAGRAAARWFPGRAACLENSLAAVLTALLLRRSLDWCIGARLMPYAAHAWVEAGGRPVGETASPDRPYLLLLRT